MNAKQKDAVDSLISLSQLAADFKCGIVPDHAVINILTAIVNSMDVKNRDKVLKDSLLCWGITFPQ